MTPVIIIINAGAAEAHVKHMGERRFTVVGDLFLSVAERERERESRASSRRVIHDSPRLRLCLA